MSILSKLAEVRNASEVGTKEPMTDRQISQCKQALKRDMRGPAVQPNKFDANKPYRVTVNFNDKWTNHGLFTSADVAAAVGSLVSVSVFGEKAIAGMYDESVVESHKEFLDWIADSRNAEILGHVEAGTCLLDSVGSEELEGDKVF